MVRLYSATRPAEGGLDHGRRAPTVALTMSERPLLPLLGEPAPERRDAARNREALLVAAEALIEHCGIDGVTMDAVAAAAGVGKGTVFRRFGSREGLMAALLNFSETEWQASVISGPPPLGPGAPPMERLLAFGRSRLEVNLRLGRPDPGGRAGRDPVLRGVLVRGDARPPPAGRARGRRRHPAARDRAAGAAGGADPASSRCGSRGSTSTGSIDGWDDLAHRITQR